MGKKSGPDNSGLNQAALDSAALSKESLDWFKQEYAATAPERADATTRANAVSDAQLAGMQFATQAARDADTRNKTVFQPLEDRIVADAQAYDTEGRRMQASNEARASVETAYGNAQDGLNRTLQRQGVTPGSGRSLALMQDANLGKVKAITGATSDAVKGVEAQGYARMQDAAALGKGVVGNQATQQQIATSTGSAAVGSSGAALSAANSGAGLMQTGFSQALQGQGQAGQLYGQAGSLTNQARGQDLNFLSSTFGSFMKASSKKIKTNIKAANDEQALAEIEALDVKDYDYDPAKGGPAGMGPQTGPMAEQTRAVMGEQVAPGGHAIDMKQIGGKLLLGMQALSKRLDTLEQRKAA